MARPKAEKPAVVMRVETVSWVNSAIPFSVAIPATEAESAMAMIARITRQGIEYQQRDGYQCSNQDDGEQDDEPLSR